MSLFNLAFARQQGGSFVLRVEDTDRARFREDSEQQVYDMLRWLGLPWDEGPDVGGPYAPYRQSERLGTYRPHVERLLADGHAYHCWCSGERLQQMREEQQKRKVPTGYDRLCVGKTAQERAQLPGYQETPVVRMLVPDDVPLSFVDLVRGEVSAPRPTTRCCSRATASRPTTWPSSSTTTSWASRTSSAARSGSPRRPSTCCCSTGSAGSGRSSRTCRCCATPTRARSPSARTRRRGLTWFVEQGYLPEALLNFLGLLGYSLPEARRRSSPSRSCRAAFDWARVNTVGPGLRPRQARWLNGHYLRALPEDELVARTLPYLRAPGWSPTRDAARPRAAGAGPLVQTRMALLSELPDLLRFLFVDEDAFTVDPAAAPRRSGPRARRC
jgi:glutamyl-tRNA synthetase